MKQHLQETQDNYKAVVDKLRKAPSSFQVRDKVWLLGKNIKTTWSCNKLNYWCLGPFSITKQINPMAYQLELPTSMKVHHVFHVLLEPYKESSILDKRKPPPPSVEVDSHEKYEVEKVLDSRHHKYKLEYFIQWQGYDINEQTWEPATNLINAPQKV